MTFVQAENALVQSKTEKIRTKQKRKKKKIENRNTVFVTEHNTAVDFLRLKHTRTHANKTAHGLSPMNTNDI